MSDEPGGRALLQAIGEGFWLEARMQAVIHDAIHRAISGRKWWVSGRLLTEKQVMVENAARVR